MHINFMRFSLCLLNISHLKMHGKYKIKFALKTVKLKGIFKNLCVYTTLLINFLKVYLLRPDLTTDQ